MKILIFLGLIVISVVFCNCGGDSNVDVEMKDNELFGELPSMIKEGELKIAELKENLSNAESQDDYMKLNVELKKFKKEFEAELAEKVKDSKICGKTIEFENLDYPDFTIEKAILDTVYSNGAFNFGFVLKMKEDSKMKRYNQIVYFKAVDKAGKDIPKGISVAASLRSNNEPDLEKVAKGSINGSLLEDFAKIKIITKEEYDKK